MLSLLFAFSLASAWAFILAHGPAALAIAVVVISSVVTAGTEHPDVVPSNVVHVLQFVLQLLSVLTPKGSASALKLPFTIAPAPAFARLPPPIVLPPPGTTTTSTQAPNGYALTSVLAPLALFCLMLAACSYFRPTLPADEKACAVAGLHDVEAAAASILLTGGANYEAQLFALGAQVGKDTLVCAVEAAIADFGRALPVDAGAPAEGNALVSESPGGSYAAGIARGKAALAKLAAAPGAALPAPSP